MTEEKVWELLAELVTSQKKTDEQLAKTDAKLAETSAKIDRVSEMVGGISNNQARLPRRVPRLTDSLRWMTIT